MWDFQSGVVKQIISPLEPKGGADSWITALQGSARSPARAWGCSSCFLSPNPEGEK